MHMLLFHEQKHLESSTNDLEEGSQEQPVSPHTGTVLMSGRNGRQSHDNHACSPTPNVL